MDAIAAQHPVRAIAVLRDGAEAGLLAAAAVVLVHLICDLAIAEPLRTPATLLALLDGGHTWGAAFHFGVVDAARYSSTLVTLWLVVGLVFSLLVAVSDAYPKVWYAAVAVMTILLSSVLYLAWALEVPDLPPLNLSLGVLAGASAMLGFLALRHPGFRKQFDRVQLTSVGAHDLADAYECEWYTRAQYHSVIERFGDVPAFTAAEQAKDHHIATLLGLFDAFDLDPPQELHAADLPHPTSLEQACRDGIAQERAIATMYDRFLLAVEEHKLWDAFESLRWSSEAQIMAGFQNALKAEFDPGPAGDRRNE